MIYLDTSALVKLIANETESAALRTYLGARTEQNWFTAALTRTELIRAASRTASRGAVEHVRSLLASLDLVALTDRLLDVAATLAPASLRTLDAIHLAAAMTAGPRLDAIVTYDDRMATAASDAGLTLAQPTQ
ncbi:MAG TPA: type II toxin-antitoxin system VapC family toxin [Mycobacterium sp.]|nr:type II toxin-antitoxin system VapC family toxin [Mycobacterium sp.]